MRRLILFLVCVLLGLGMLSAGLLLPAHLRAVDAKLLRHAGRGTESLGDRGLALAGDNKLGAAQLVLTAAQQLSLPTDRLRLATDNLSRQHGRWLVWGGPEPRFDSIFEPDKRLDESTSQPFTLYVIRESNRQRVLASLSKNPNRILRELLQLRGFTNTTLFTPSQSSSGQALDAAIAICGLLLEGRYLPAKFTEELGHLTGQAVASGNSLRLEATLLDLTSLGQRLNWGQLVEFVSHIEDAETLRLLVRLLRQDESRLPMLFSAVLLSGNPAAVTQYLMNFGETGWKDLCASLRYNAGGVKELLHRNQRLHFSRWLRGWAMGISLQRPYLGLTIKWFLYLAGGFCLAASLHYVRRPVAALERPLQVHGFHMVREILFALGFLVAVLLVTEPFLSQETRPFNFPFQVRLPTLGNIAPPSATQNQVQTKIMNQLSLLALLLFFVLQGLLYLASLLKLAEIRRQNVPPRIKLRLLENEDHLFDAGLYLGFVGTIICLILVSLGVIKPSLMAAYSSTSFGITFVSLFKIVNLRPTRRKLLMEAEMQAAQAAARGATSSLVTP